MRIYAAYREELDSGGTLESAYAAAARVAGRSRSTIQGVVKAIEAEISLEQTAIGETDAGR